VEVVAPAPGHLVWSRTFFPGWKAILDETPVRVLLANGRDLAVAVPPGRHRLRIYWNPGTFRTGVVIQAAVLLLILIAGGAALIRRGRLPQT
jgi:uncharacterized membrane protein YfhO